MLTYCRRLSYQPDADTMSLNVENPANATASEKVGGLCVENGASLCGIALRPCETQPD